MYIQNYRVQKKWFDKLLKGPFSEDNWSDNMANGPKHFLNLSDRIFTIFIDHCEEN